MKIVIIFLLLISCENKKDIEVNRKKNSQLCFLLSVRYNVNLREQIPRNTPFDDPIGATIISNSISLLYACQEYLNKEKKDLFFK